ncbi:MAG TPA: hypothetical protein VFS67_04870 [Polyangiaceae bacterium]|nr:hypothetical protein [Polyangiaceae bacterium]
MFRGLVRRGRELARARGGALLLLLSIGIGLLELVGQLHFSHAAPRLADWEALRPTVERLAQDHPLIIVAPHWAEPNARLAFGDELMPLEHVARADDSGFEQVLQISILGQSAPELRGWQRESELRVGRFQLERWRNPAAEKVLYDFLAHVEPPALDVALEDAVGEHSSPCSFGPARVSNGDLFGHPTFPSPRFSCSSSDWQFVGRTVIEDQQYLPRRCIWAHPPGRGALRLHFDAVPIGRKIRGHGGTPWFFERERRGADILLEVRVGTEVVGTYRHADREGWKPFEFSTERFAGQVLPVEFRVWARSASQREFCFQADTR